MLIRIHLRSNYDLLSAAQPGAENTPILWPKNGKNMKVGDLWLRGKPERDGADYLGPLATDMVN